MSPEDLPDSLSLIKSHLASRKKKLRVDRETYLTLVNGVYFCRSLSEVLLDADDIFLRLRVADLGEVFSTLMGLSLADQIAVLKYWTAWPMARWLRNKDILLARPACLPVAQSCFDFPLRGPLRKHFRNLLASRTSSFRAGTLFTGILQGVKRGCAPVPEEFEVQSCLKHKKALSNPVPLSHRCDFDEKFHAIWGRTISRDHPTSSAVDLREKRWRKVHSNRFVRRVLRVPSTHASVEATRSAGGRRQIIHSINCDLLGEPRDPRLISEPPLLDMFERHGRVVERRGWPSAPYDRFLRLAADHVRGRDLKAQVELCLEPLKCRVITKGESLPYFVAQTFQKAAWECLQDLPACALTAQPVDASMLYDLELRTNRLNLPFDQWVSGDYSAATDGLSLEVNQACLDALLGRLQASLDERDVCRKVLGCHEVSYPSRLRREGDGLDPFTMRNGQLMGSVLSFPVLCAINLAAYWCALEEYTGRRYRKEDLPVLVNGDDILFKANVDFYEVWKKWIARAGFSLSLGKNYISPNFITVNSESWIHRGASRFDKLPFLNCGLLLQEAQGPFRVPIRAETAERPLIPKLQWILDNAANPARAFDRIKHHWRRSIAIHTENGRFNLCAPRELGGCGLIVPHVCRHRVRFTAFQQLLAGRSLRVWRDMEGRTVRECPRSGLERISVNVVSPSGIPVHEDRTGTAVVRGVTEPIHGPGEVRFSDCSASRRVAVDLNPFQICSDFERPVFSLNRIPRRRLAAVFAANERIVAPFSFALEVRKLLTRGPTDDASPPVLEPEIIAEMATEQVSARTDSLLRKSGGVRRW